MLIASILAPIAQCYSLISASEPANLTYARSLELGPSSLLGLLKDPKCPQAVTYFELGIQLYHVFWFDLARTAFEQSVQESKLCATQFPMAGWGLALTAKMPIWHSEDVEFAQEVLSGPVMEGCTNAVEDTLIHAAKTYFANGKSVQEREAAYAAEMKAIYLDHKDNADISALYGLSMLGLASSAGPTVMDETRTLLDGLEKQFPSHRGILHYYVHAHDDPKYALSAVSGALRLSALTKGSSHALHMQSHLFLGLGDFKHVYSANNDAVAAADSFCAATKQGPLCDLDNRYHALEWRQYSSLQMGNINVAMQDLSRVIDITQDAEKLLEWKYRMYARQQIMQLDSDVAPFQSDSLPTPMTMDTGVFWKAYSESGALVAKTARLAKKYKGDRLMLAEIRGEVEVRFQKLIGFKVADKYVAKLVEIDYYQARGMLAEGYGNPSLALQEFRRAADLELGNIKVADSPTLPVIPALETLALFYQSIGSQNAEATWKLLHDKWNRNAPPRKYNK